VLPEEAESLAMPAEEGVRCEDEQRCLPVFGATGEEDEPKTIRLRKEELVDLAVKDDELLPEQGILSGAIGSTAYEVCGGTENNRVPGRLGEMEEGLFKERKETGDDVG
jgi:hypothetical protein